MIIHIVILLLKIIGILLLSMIGLILLVSIIVLASPIRYRFHAEYLENEQPQGLVKVTWLAHILSIQVEYKEKEFVYFAKIFGIQVFPKKNPKEKMRKKQKPLPETIGYLENPEEGDEKVPTKKNTDKKEGFKQEIREEENLQEEDKIEKNSEKEIIEEKFPPLLIEQKELEPTIEKQKRKRKQKIKKPSLIQRIKQKIEKIKQFFKAIPKKIKTIKKTWNAKKQQLKQYREFYLEEETQLALKKVKKLVRKCGVHTLPRKFEGMVHFGTNDPALTGQILGILSIGMPIYKEHLKIVPAFDRAIFEIQVRGKGRIQIGYYLYILLVAVLDKNIRNVIKVAKKKLK